MLRRADIGIAWALCSDAAIEAADVVLMDDDPLQIAKAIQISRKCLRIVYQNIALAIGVKLVCLVLVAFGFANMWLAVFADVGVMILAVFNAIRALFVKRSERGAAQAGMRPRRLNGGGRPLTAHGTESVSPRRFMPSRAVFQRKRPRNS